MSRSLKFSKKNIFQTKLKNILAKFMQAFQIHRIVYIYKSARLFFTLLPFDIMPNYSKYRARYLNITVYKTGDTAFCLCPLSLNYGSNNTIFI